MSTIPRDGLRLLETIRVLLYTTLTATLAAELGARVAVFSLALEPPVPALAPGAAARAAGLAALGASVAWWMFEHVSERPAIPFLFLAAWTALLSLVATLAHPSFGGVSAAEAGVVLALHVLVLAIVVPPYLRLARE